MSASRKTPGRPPSVAGRRQNRRNITLDEAHAEKARRIGGSVSEGIRLALDAWEETQAAQAAGDEK